MKLDDLDLAGGAVLFVARGPLPDGLVRTEDRQRLGYQADHSILEVLVDAGAVWDTEAWWAVTSQDRTSDHYVVTFPSEDPIEGGR